RKKGSDRSRGPLPAQCKPWNTGEKSECVVDPHARGQLVVGTGAAFGVAQRRGDEGPFHTHQRERIRGVHRGGLLGRGGTLAVHHATTGGTENGVHTHGFVSTALGEAGVQHRVLAELVAGGNAGTVFVLVLANDLHGFDAGAQRQGAGGVSHGRA